MGLDMHDRDKVCGEIFRRYQRLGKEKRRKEQGKIPDEYAVTPGFNRDYLAHKPANRGNTVNTVVGGRQAGENHRQTAPETR